MSPIASNTWYNNAVAQPRFHESTSLPPSRHTNLSRIKQSPTEQFNPSHPVRLAPQPKPTIVKVKRPPPPPPAPVSKPEQVRKTTSSFTSMTTIPASAAAALTADALPTIPAGSEQSILDFGKVSPGDETDAPSIMLHIPLNGETNKHVNFLRMAEERYGWDALHPRLAANRERKARIAAASAALEKSGSRRESGDNMDEDIQSDAYVSNVEMGGVANGVGNGNATTNGNGGGTSGPDGAPVKPAQKKRNFKEDEYDKDDDFVDDSDMLWEEQAAASRDGFFVYSGPLIPEVKKPVVPTGPPKRGRGGRGRASYLSAQYNSREMTLLKRPVDEHSKQANASIPSLQNDLARNQQLITADLAESKTRSEQTALEVDELKPLRRSLALLKQQVDQDKEATKPVSELAKKLFNLQKDVVKIQKSTLQSIKEKLLIEQRISVLERKLDGIDASRQVPPETVGFINKIFLRSEKLMKLLDDHEAEAADICATQPAPSTLQK
ncbi:hypothetical protein B0T26DRAFT_876334 [Lasiosphaeria miniovina]|uniref:Hpc2-related domain-containing protein n=1 Tax=Lasiosphaeria miniovina TaxID=1954250 RepID=A0AA39ZTJ9_9PEZI|nr:uncharacterized protein B0T26DRAFT_876334 [Lasiosphaeria miniovina]KAK0703298.1 hypothetical protein B0T26DRAFT_876334 [Lasiosphaeria miniovina]